MSMGSVRTILLTACVLATLSLSGVAPALAGPLDGLPAVRNKVMLHEGRQLLTPSFGVTVNDPYVQQIMLGVGWRYFTHDWLGFGVDIMGGGGVKTDLTDRINDQLALVDKTHQVENTSLQALLHGTVEIIPIQGKVMLFGGQLARFAVSAQAGFGIALIGGDDSFEKEFSQNEASRISMMPMFGGGVRLFPSPWIAIGFDVRDYLVNRALSTDRTGAIPETRLGHNVLTQLSVSFVFPQMPSVRP
jgi:outer membrane beta-barrel protein